MYKFIQAIDDNKARELFVSHNLTIEEALKKLEQNEHKILFLIKEDSTIVGSLSDGDIRRGLLQHKNITHQVEDICNKKPIVVSSRDEIEESYENLINENIFYIPLTDAKNKIKQVYSLKKPKPKNINNYFVILAGGLGTRLSPLTNSCPKPLLKVKGEPILSHIIKNAAKHGFQNFIISLNYLGEKIESFFGDGKSLGVNIKYIRETKRLGTAGSIFNVRKFTKEPVLVSNGDIITNFNYSNLLDFHITNNALATIAIKEHIIQHPYGVIKHKNLLFQGIEEKPLYRSFVNAGIYCLNHGFFDFIQENTYQDMPDILDLAKSNGHTPLLYPITEDWLDIGKIQDFQAANAGP